MKNSIRKLNLCNLGDIFVVVVVVLCRLKIFVPIAFLAWTVLVPVNWTDHGLEAAESNNVTSSDIDMLSISNVEEKSQRSKKPHFLPLLFHFSMFF